MYVRPLLWRLSNQFGAERTDECTDGNTRAVDGEAGVPEDRRRSRTAAGDRRTTVVTTLGFAWLLGRPRKRGFVAFQKNFILH